MWVALVMAQQAAGGFGEQMIRPDRLEAEVATWVAALLAGEGCFGLVSAHGPKLLGFIAVVQNWRPWLRPPLSATIIAIWVEPHVRRQGIGRRLVIAAQRRLTRNGVDIVDLHALPSPHTAAQFWHDQGFVHTTTYMLRSRAVGPAAA